MKFDYSTFNNFPKDKQTVREIQEFEKKLEAPYKRYGIANPYDRIYETDRPNSDYTDYELEAIKYIKENKQLPIELEKLLLDTKEERVKARKDREEKNKRKIPSKEELDELLKEIKPD